MHIKRLTVRGFKTYRDVTTLDFTPGCNAIVGLNGSGKSNLLKAIEFLMADGKFSRKAAILHEGASSAVLNGFVEIVLDNRDRSLSGIVTDEVTFKRSFSSKKDEFAMDGKHITKDNFHKILESAGVCRTSKYNIVQQGQVMELATMTDENRLKLLKDFAGISLYVNKRIEAIKELKTSFEHTEVSDETLARISCRVDQLKEENRELVEFNQADLTRRWLEFLINERLAKESEAEIARHERQLSDLSDRIEQLTRKEEEEEEHAKDVRERIEKAEVDCKKADIALRKVKDNELEIARERAKLDLELKQTEKRGAQIESKKAELTRIIQGIEALEHTLTRELQPRLEEAKGMCAEVLGAKERLQFQDCQITAKISRKDQFRTVAERNRVLSLDMKPLESHARKVDSEVSLLQKKIAGLPTVHEGEDTSRRGQLVEEKEKLITERATIEAKRCEVHLEVNQLEREEVDIREKLHVLRQEREGLGREAQGKMADIERTMRVGQSRAGWLARQWADERGCSHWVKGTLLENIYVDEEYEIAVEVAASAQIFNLIVESSDTASEFIHYLKQKGERCGTTITPLSEIRVKPVTFPSEQKMRDRAIPLTRLIRVEDASIMPAVQQVFGKFLLVKDADVGNIFAREGFDCVTKEGEKVTRKGILSGGCRQRLTRMKNLREYRQKLKEKTHVEAHEKEGEARASTCTRERNLLRRKLEEFVDHKRHIQDKIEEITGEIQRIDNGRQFETLEREKLESRLKTKQEDLYKTREKIAALETEMKSSTLGALTPEETEFLKKVDKDKMALEKKLKNLESKRATASRRVEEMGNKLSLERARKKNLEQEIEDFGASQENSEGFNDIILRRRILVKQEEEVKAKRKTVEESKNEKQKVVDSLSGAVSEHSREAKKSARKVRLLNEESASLSEKIQEAKMKKAELDGKKLLPSEVVVGKERLEVMTSADLQIELKKMNAFLQQFQNVNKKAANQLTEYMDDKNRLNEEKTKLQNCCTRIFDLIDNLDKEKEDTIMNTFNDLNVKFGKAFGELVPGGKARLVLKKNPQEEVNKIHEDKEASLSQHRGENGELDPIKKRLLELDFEMYKQNASGFDLLYRGVALKASFTGHETTFLSLHQLSGGQKTVVAMALILGIQQLNPAPFYLFDEVDAALDDKYRHALAQLIGQYSSTAQFLVTTFRRQLLEESDKFFLVTSSNRCSTVQEVGLEDAIAVVEQQQLEAS